MRFCLLTIFLFTIHFAFSQITKDTICILQLNDVYEIGPLEHGNTGGMAKVATLIKQAEQRYQTFVVLAGDFVSPSVIGTTKIDGQKVNGRHMIDMMNKAGVDLVTFGNHEFDIPEKDLQQRINESQFTWLSSDVVHKNADGSLMPFYKTVPDSAALPTSYILTSTNNQFKIGIISASINSNPQSWVVYRDHLEWIKKAYQQVKKRSDIVIGITHLSLAEDKTVMRKLKRLRLIMGGHEHQHNYVRIRKGAIAKADANAKTIYRHLIFKDGKKIKIISELIHADSTVAPDAGIAAAVKIWEDKAYASFRAIGLEPDAVVYHTKEPLDGTEANIRFRQTNLGNLIAASMMAASTTADAAIFNSGSIRIDDRIEGVVTQLDVIRTLPFGGKLCEVQMTGALLNKALNTSNSIKGLGGYLQTSTNINFKEGKWMLNDKIIADEKIYTIVSAEYLFTGQEKGMEFLNDQNTDIKSIKRFDAVNDVRTDIRLAVVKYLSSLSN
ncbi:MAG: bifunctional metallophosphatase/5'-nucleotidase [Ferruginibacter sp.]